MSQKLKDRVGKGISAQASHGTFTYCINSSHFTGWL